MSKEVIENYKRLKQSCKNKNNGLGVIDMSSVENIPDFKMTQGEKKK